IGGGQKGGISMTVRRHRKLIVQAMIVLLVSIAVPATTPQSERSFGDFWGPRFGAQPGARDQKPFDVQEVDAPDVPPSGATAAILRWNSISIDASGLDHTPVAPGENRVFGEQVGPCRAARAIAIVHIAIFEALNAITPTFRSYLNLTPKKGPASADAAVAQAAHDTLVALWPSQAPAFHQKLADDLALIPDGQLKTIGIIFGQRAAAGILAMRAFDGSAH